MNPDSVPSGVGEVDKLQASNRARELADKAVRECFQPDSRDSMDAHAHWAREFRRQFNALTKPAPGSILRYDAAAHAAAYPGY